MGPDGRFRVSIANNTITALISTAEADCGLLHTAETPFYGWLHLAIAYDGTGGIPDENFAVMYLDGVEISRTQCNGAVLSATQPLNFGKGLDACFDQARFYATAVPYEELLMLQEFDGAYLKTGTVLDVCFSNDNLGVMPPAPAFLDSSASAAEVDMIGGAFIVDTGISGNSVFMEPSEYLVVDSVLTPVFTVEGMGVTFWLNPRFQPNEGDIAYIVRRPDTFRVVLNYETPSGENELCLELMAGDPPSWQTYCAEGVVRFDEWHAYAISVDPLSDNKVKIWVDGIEVWSAELAGQPADNPAQHDMFVSEAFLGRFGSLKVYSRALTFEDVAANSFRHNVNVHYDFDDPKLDEGVLADMSDFANDAEYVSAQVSHVEYDPNSTDYPSALVRGSAWFAPVSEQQVGEVTFKDSMDLWTAQFMVSIWVYICTSSEDSCGDFPKGSVFHKGAIDPTVAVGYDVTTQQLHVAVGEAVQSLPFTHFDEWTQIVVWADQSTGPCTFSVWVAPIAGAPEHHENMACPGGFHWDDSDWYLGAGEQGGEKWVFEGMMDEFHLFYDNPSIEYVQDALHKHAAQHSWAAASYDFDSKLDDVTDDSTPYANHAELVGNPQFSWQFGPVQCAPECTGGEKCCAHGLCVPEEEECFDCGPFPPECPQDEECCANGLCKPSGECPEVPDWESFACPDSSCIRIDGMNDTVQHVDPVDMDEFNSGAGDTVLSQWFQPSPDSFVSPAREVMYLPLLLEQVGYLEDGLLARVVRKIPEMGTVWSPSTWQWKTHGSWKGALKLSKYSLWHYLAMEISPLEKVVRCFVDGELTHVQKSPSYQFESVQSVALGAAATEFMSGPPRPYLGLLDSVEVRGKTVGVGEQRRIASRDHLRSYWTFDRHYQDSWPSDNALETTHGNPVFVPGYLGAAAQLDGNGTYFKSQPDSASMDSSEYALWTGAAFRTKDGIISSQYLLTKGQATQEAFSVKVSQATLEVRIGTQSHPFDIDNDCSQGCKWHSIGLKVLPNMEPPPTGYYVSLFYDGEYHSTALLQEPWGFIEPLSGPFYIGAHPQGTNPYSKFAGLIDEVFVSGVPIPDSVLAYMGHRIVGIWHMLGEYEGGNFDRFSIPTRCPFPIGPGEECPMPWPVRGAHAYFTNDSKVPGAAPLPTFTACQHEGEPPFDTNDGHCLVLNWDEENQQVTDYYDQFVVTKSDIDDDARRGHTFAAWVNLKGDSGRIIWGLGRGYLLSGPNDQNPALLVRSLSDQTEMYVNGESFPVLSGGQPLAIARNEWHHVAFVLNAWAWDEPTGTWRTEVQFYLDGQPADPIVDVEAGPAIIEEDFGTGIACPDQQFKGLLDQVYVLNRPVGNAEIQGMKNGTWP